MMKVVIVDDNAMVVESLCTLINWELLGFELPFKAYEAEEVLEYFKDKTADILITDIKMPGMDGLELIQALKGIGAQPKVIVLSSYNEFRLVREAFKLGACEYIQKTELNPPELEKLLVELSEQIMNETKEEQSELSKYNPINEYDLWFNETNRELHKNRRLVKERLWREFSQGHRSQECFLSEIKDYMEIKYIEGNHVILYLSADNFKRILEVTWGGNEELLSFAVLNIVEEVANETMRADAFYPGFGSFVVVFSSANIETSMDNEHWKAVFNRILQVLKLHLGIRISGGIAFSNCIDKAICGLYSEALKACQYRIILGEGRLIFNEEITLESVNRDIRPQERIHFLKNILETKRKNLLKEAQSVLFIRQEDVTFDNYKEVIRLYEKYSFILYEFLKQNDFSEQLKNKVDSFSEIVYDMETVPELNMKLSEVLMELMHHELTGNKIVKEFLDYVQNNYNKDISLHSASEFLCYNSLYLGRLINKELGSSFSEYLSNYRIEKAKEFFRKGDSKIYEVSEKVGFNNHEYFSKVFKKLTGYSPKEYMGVKQ